MQREYQTYLEGLVDQYLTIQDLGRELAESGVTMTASMGARGDTVQRPGEET
jgi:hypothetical protein